MKFDYNSAFARQRRHSLWKHWGPWPDSGGRSGRAWNRGPAVRAGLLGLFIYRRSASAGLCAVPVIAVTCVHLLMHSNARYTFVVEPPLIALAWAGTLAWLSPRLGGDAGDSGSHTRAEL